MGRRDAAEARGRRAEALAAGSLRDAGGLAADVAGGRDLDGAEAALSGLRLAQSPDRGSPGAFAVAP